jgi:hypothetical protein
MMHRSLPLPIFIFIALVVNAQPSSVLQRLGYPADTKLLIIHADDLGVSHSENTASINAMEKGSVSSASIMVPCPWFPEIANYASAHPDADFGLHLTLTSEWKYYKWGPVVPRSQTPGLVNEQGYLYDEVAPVGQHASAAEVEQELRAQIERAKKFGIQFTHFDTHMGSVAARPEFAKIYVQLGREYRVPVLLNHDIVNGLGLTDFITDKDVVLDQLYMASPDDYKKGMDTFYSGVIKSLKPGLNLLILHAAFDSDEMKAVTIDHPDYGAAWRQADYDFFTSEACKKLLQDQKIKVITWKSVRDKLMP